MKLELLHNTAIDMAAEFGDESWHCASYVPFKDGRLVMLAKPYGTGDYWLVQLRDGKVDKRKLPAALHAEMLEFADAYWDDQHHYRLSLKAFSVGGKLALLLADRKLYLLDDISSELVPLDIDNALAKWSSEFEQEEPGYASAPSRKATFFAQDFGPTQDQRVPVTFRGFHCDSVNNFLALLSVDVAQGRARWEAGRLPHAPMTIQYGPYLGNTGYACFSHAAWQGSTGLAFGVGNMEPHFRLGMQFVELLEIDERANVLASRLTIDEACYGKFSADLKWLLLTPMYKKYSRKGKQTVVALENHAETPIALPRGCTKLRVLDILGEHAWLAGDDSSAIVSCRIAT
ncbi:hypothetical protein GM658_16210 [Pseudoduganella eburnea]|uniref:Uncharacterized protein n=1 Tax=Massilia eburnea TaxID=1776165 RepID=A0A6L6QIR9_9BURK|nr:hypothetical protein [Massilia eburnea]MTW12149.1 hypothetical protein [Massilia eburnea]